MSADHRERRGWPDRHPVLGRLTLPILASVCALLWGSAFPAIKTAYRLMGDPGLAELTAFAGVRFTLAGALLLLFTRDLAGQIRRVPKLALLAVAATQVSVNYFFFYWSMSLIDGVLGAILNASTSFWQALLAPLLLREKPMGLVQWLCILLGFAGVAVCVWRPGGASTAPFLGVVLMLASAIASAAAIFLVRPLHKHVSIPFITGCALFFGGLSLALAGGPGLAGLAHSASPALVGLTLYLAMVSAVAFSLWYLLATLYDLALLSGYRYLIPIFGAVESALLIPGESIGAPIAVGGALTLFSVWLLERLRRPLRRG